MSVSFSSPKSQDDFPRREASKEEGNDRQLREHQIPDLAVSFAPCRSPKQDSGLAQKGDAGPPHGLMAKKLIELGEVLEKTPGQDRHCI